MTKGHVHLEYVDLPDIVDVAKLGTVIEVDRNLLYKPTCKGPKRGKLLEAETTHHPPGGIGPMDYTIIWRSSEGKLGRTWTYT